MKLFFEIFSHSRDRCRYLIKTFELSCRMMWSAMWSLILSPFFFVKLIHVVNVANSRANYDEMKSLLILINYHKINKCERLMRW